MKKNKIVLGAFWIEGTDQHFFGLKDAKNYQMVKGGNILDPHKKLLYPDPYPTAADCTSCGNKVRPVGAFLGAPMEELPAKCSDCGGTWAPKTTEEEMVAMAATAKAKKKSGGFFSFLKRS